MDHLSYFRHLQQLNLLTSPRQLDDCFRRVAFEGDLLLDFLLDDELQLLAALVKQRLNLLGATE